MTSSASKDGFYFDEDAADRAVHFFERYLRHVKAEWAGEAFELLPWQRDDLIRPLFGWMREDGLRKYRTAYIEIPRKNGKSALCSGIALYLLFADREPGAEIYSAAADKDQARIVFDTARQMVEASPDLMSRAKLYQYSIVLPALGSFYKVISADAYTKHGFNAHGIVVDELHAQKKRELWDVLTTSTAARRQPLTVAITTAGVDRESICYELHTYAKQVQQGIVQDDAFFSLLYAADEDDDWSDPEVWKKANPSYGVSVKPDYLEGKYRTAKATPSFQNTFKRLHLNIWTQQVDRWIDMDKWDESAGNQVAEEDLEGKLCFGGLDLSSVTDLTSWVMLFPDPLDFETVRVVPRFWVPKAKVYDSQNRYADQYQAWADAGLLTLVEGDVIDYALIRDQVTADAERFFLDSANIDRLWQGYQLTMELQAAGINIYPFGQGFLSMANPTREFERRVMSGKIQHGGHQVLRWMANAAAVSYDAAGNMKPNKAESQGKIDGIVAMVMALDRAMRGEENHRSVYEERGIITI